MPWGNTRMARILLLTLTLGLVSTAPTLFTPRTVAADIDSRSLVAYLDRGNNLWISRDNGDDARQVTTTGGFSEIAWSADGSRLAVIGPHEGTAGVFMTSPDAGFGFRTLTKGGNPLWSPDSSRLALVDSGTIQVYDREATYMRGGNVGADALGWSPTSARIGFTRIVDDPYNTDCEVRELGWFDIFSGESQIVGRSIGKFAWAGDGNRLLYVSASDGAIKSYDTSNGAVRTLSTRLANPCGGPFFTDVDGGRLFFLDYGSGGRTLIALNVDSLQEQVYSDVPVSYPADQLPESYVTVDTASRNAYVVQTYPTTITRIDLQSGGRSTLLFNDHRMFLGFSSDHSRIALIDAPFGKPSVTSVRDVATGQEVAFSNVGWLSWQSSAVTPSSVLAWDRVWDREDRAVAAGAAQRTWIWGPEAFNTLQENYDNAPGGQRAVRYYDKSRMEVTTPFGDQGSRWYVTNGLLARELITGELQVGDARFIERNPANVPVAGDSDDPNSPTYATLRGVLNAGALAPGTEIRTTIDRQGNTGNGGRGGVFASQVIGETNHTVANVFWDYLNSEGQVWNGSSFQNGRLFDPTFFATGFPITEAYWTRVKVGGQEKDVLLQCFERRCLTYTPDNPDGWKVEMGNVGRHYYTWRYSE